MGREFQSNAFFWLPSRNNAIIRAKLGQILASTYCPIPSSCINPRSVLQRKVDRKGEAKEYQGCRGQEGKTLSWTQTGGASPLRAKKEQARKKSPFYGLCPSVFTKQRGAIPKSGRNRQESGSKKPFLPGFENF